MKTTVKILLILFVSLSCKSVFGGIEDYGIATYRQPNGFSFQGRHFVDEFGEYFLTPEGYLFQHDAGDGYFHYVMMDEVSNLSVSRARVGIDDPQKEGIPKDIFSTAQWQEKVAKARGWRAQSGRLSKSVEPSVTAAPASVYLQILLVEFSDIKHRNLNDWPMNLGYGDSLPDYREFTRSEFEMLFFSQNVYHNTSPDGDPVYGSMRDYFSDISQGAFTLTGTVLNQNQPGTAIPKWVVLPETKTYYHNQSPAGYFDDFEDAVLSAAQTQQQITPVLDGTHKLCILYAGNMYATGQLHPATSGNVFIGSERFKYPPSGISRNSEVNAATFTHIGVHCHEFGHILGLYDHYYTYTYGKWGLMANGGNKGGTTTTFEGTIPLQSFPNSDTISDG